jgi:hypothetical protein
MSAHGTSALALDAGACVGKRMRRSEVSLYVHSPYTIVGAKGRCLRLVAVDRPELLSTQGLSGLCEAERQPTARVACRY